MLLKVPIRKKVVISLTPLIDVVFILLVFFMLASSFVDWRSYDLATAMPADKPLNTPPANAAGLSGVAILAIKASGNWVVDGEISPSPVAAERLLRNRLAAVPDLTVVVKPDGTVPLQAAMDAFDTVQSIGVKSVSLRPGSVE